MSRRLLYGAALLPQLLFLGYLIGSEEWSLHHGTRVLLQVESRRAWNGPAYSRYDVDVAINEVDRSLARGDPFEPEAGDLIYVWLEPVGEVHRAAGFSRERPAAEVGPFLRGRVRSVSDGPMRVDYGLSHFRGPVHAPQIGGQCETRLAVRIGRNGAGHVEDLVVDGLPFAEWSRRQEEQQR